jgi:hypothetical protein
MKKVESDPTTILREATIPPIYDPMSPREKYSNIRVYSIKLGII